VNAIYNVLHTPYIHSMLTKMQYCDIYTYFCSCTYSQFYKGISASSETHCIRDSSSSASSIEAKTTGQSQYLRNTDSAGRNLRQVFLSSKPGTPIHFVLCKHNTTRRNYTKIVCK